MPDTCQHENPCSCIIQSKASTILAPNSIYDDVVPLVNPCQQHWLDHYEWRDDGKLVAGKTPVRRATVSRLKMNQLRVIEARNIWGLAGILLNRRFLNSISRAQTRTVITSSEVCVLSVNAIEGNVKL